MSTSATDAERLFTAFSSYIVSAVGRFDVQKFGLEREDLVQDVYLKFWLAYNHNAGDIRHVQAYISRIVDSVFINQLNRIRREDRCLEVSPVVRETFVFPAPEPDRENGRLAGLVLDSIAAYKGDKRRAMTLRLSGLSIQEIARLNGWTYRKTYHLVDRVLKDIKARLERRGLAHGGA